MAYKLFITQNAADELDEIVNYIGSCLNNPSAVISFLDKIKECYTRLSDNPKIYQLCNYHDFKEKGYRKVVINNYVMIYRIEEESGIVYILHFFFGRQDYYKIL